MKPLEQKLSKWLDQQIARLKREQRKRTPFDFERGSDLLAYIEVKNWLEKQRQAR